MRREALAEHFGSGIANEIRGDSMAIHRIGAEQGAIANNIDDARNADGEAMHFRERAWRKDVVGSTRYAQAMSHIRGGFGGGERVQVIPAGDTLGQLSQLVSCEQLTQFGLT